MMLMTMAAISVRLKPALSWSAVAAGSAIIELSTSTPTIGMAAATAEAVSREKA